MTFQVWRYSLKCALLWVRKIHADHHSSAILVKRSCGDQVGTISRHSVLREYYGVISPIEITEQSAFSHYGPLAQRSEQAAHNCLVLGSNPGRSIYYCRSESVALRNYEKYFTR
jgi:hypothetical protein